jgi:hypothetical protein
MKRPARLACRTATLAVFSAAIGTLLAPDETGVIAATGALPIRIAPASADAAPTAQLFPKKGGSEARVAAPKPFLQFPS